MTTVHLKSFVRHKCLSISLTSLHIQNISFQFSRKAAKLILDKPLYSFATKAESQLGWLNLEQRRLFHRYLYVYKCVNGITSHSMELLRNSHVHRYSTRRRAILDFHL